VLFGSDKGALHGVYTGLITPFLFAEAIKPDHFAAAGWLLRLFAFW